MLLFAFCLDRCFVGRVLVAGLGSIEEQTVTAILVGVVEVLGRATIVMRDQIAARVLFCSASYRRGFFSNPRRVQFLSDNILLQMASEWLAIFCACFLWMQCRIYMLQVSPSTAISDFCAAFFLQSLVMLVVDCVSCAIELQLGFPLDKAWRGRWWLSIRHWLTIVYICVSGGILFSFNSYSTLYAQVTDKP